MRKPRLYIRLLIVILSVAAALALMISVRVTAHAFGVRSGQMAGKGFRAPVSVATVSGGAEDAAGAVAIRYPTATSELGESVEKAAKVERAGITALLQLPPHMVIQRLPAAGQGSVLHTGSLARPAIAGDRRPGGLRVASQRLMND